jgi:hypothetical protein
VHPVVRNPDTTVYVVRRKILRRSLKNTTVAIFTRIDIAREVMMRKLKKKRGSLPYHRLFLLVQFTHLLVQRKSV